MTHSTPHPLHTVLAGSRIAQIAILTVVWAAGCGLARLTGIAVPGSLIGMLALLWLLALRAVDPRLLERGAGWLQAEMLLFFVPAVVALLAHPEFLGMSGLKVLLVILGSTVMVMVATAFTVELGLRWMSPHARPVAALE